MILLLLIAMIFSAAPAEAAYCRDFKSLKKKVEFCDDNEHYSEAAVLCLQALEKQVAAATKAMDKSLAKPGERSAQKDSLDNTDSNYKLSAATLNVLLAMAKGGAAEVLRYAESLELPEDADNEQITKGDVDGFIMQAECYSRADKVMNKVLGRYLHHILSLERAKAASLANSGAANFSGVKLDAQSFSTNLDPAPAPVPASRAPKGPKGKNWNASDISGTKDKKTDR